MTDGFQIQLSSKEIYTLAAILGFPSVIGIEENTLRSWGVDLRCHIRSSAAKLERKKLIECGMQGKFKILPKLREMISCLCLPEQVLLLSGNLKPGRRSMVAALKSEPGTVTVCNLDADTYKLRLLSAYDPTDTVSAFLDGTETVSLKERLLLEDAVYIREKALSFELEEARRRLLLCIAVADTADNLLAVLSGQSKTLEMRMLHRENGYYANTNRMILAVTSKHAMTVKADNSGILHFDGINPEKFLSAFRTSHFCFTEEVKSDG